MILANAVIINEEFRPIRADIRVENGKIAAIGTFTDEEERMDLSGMTVMPGFIDTHIHGAAGVRISDDAADLAAITRFEATQGVTSIAITTGSSSFENLLGQFRAAAAAAKHPDGAKIAGIHAEGPFISQKRKGAMTAENLLLPDAEKMERMLEAGGGLIRIITIAPEVEGGIALIRRAAARGLTVSMGHTDADYDTAMRAIDAGASRMTHTFNAARGLHHREPGVLGAALTDSRVICEMICDHVHLHPAILQMIYTLKGAGGVCMVSDSGHAAGWNVTEFTADGVTRYVRDGVVRLADGTIAGSAKTLLDGVKNLLAAGVPAGDVARMASYVPACSLHMERETGIIADGRAADFAVLDAERELRYTFLDGRCVFAHG